MGWGGKEGERGVVELEGRRRSRGRRSWAAAGTQIAASLSRASGRGCTGGTSLRGGDSNEPESAALAGSP